MIEQVKKSIQDAQLVLVGIGEELDIRRVIKSDEIYQKLIAQTKSEWIHPFIEKVFFEKYREQYLETYKQLKKCLENKNYFILTLCQDGLIKQVGLNDDRIVEPCGTYEILQCSEACDQEIYKISEQLMTGIRAYVYGEISEDIIEEPICPKCGKPLVFNRVDELNYLEAGYLAKWQTYKLWLQGTVNKKLCVLELGVGMKYPTVIRWPFEKVTFFNQKAEFFRVHSRLYQMTEEIKERGYGINSHPQEFLKELSKIF